MRRHKILSVIFLLFAITSATKSSKNDINVGSSSSNSNNNGLPPPTSRHGKILFYYPFTTRSILMMLMPLAENLAARGHQVTIISAQDAKVKGNIKFIKVDYDFEGKITAINISKKNLMNCYCALVSANVESMSQSAYEEKEGNSISNQNEEIEAWERMGVEINDIALGNTEFRGVMDKNGFDMVIFQPYLGGEVGYYIAQRSGASSVLMVSLQNSASSFLSWAVGQPHNPAYLPNFLVDFAHPMTFWERFVNCLLLTMENMHRQAISKP